MPSTGIEVRHRKACASQDGGKCDCKPTYQAQVYNRHARRTIKKTFPSGAAAKSWRREAYTAIEKGQHRTASKKTVREACEELLAGMKDGSILSDHGRPYRVDTVDSYEAEMRLRVKPKLGAYRLADLDRPAVQRFVDQLVKDGASGETIANTMCPLKVIYRRAIRRGEVYTADPTKGLEMPRKLGVRDRVATEREAAELIAALPKEDRGIWATAFYAGMRRGEIQALTWDRIDTTGDVPYMVVDRQWKLRTESFADVKTMSSSRRVPILDALRPFIQTQWDQTGGAGFVFPRETIRFRQWPADDELLAMFERSTTSGLAKELGCAPGSISSRLWRIRQGKMPRAPKPVDGLPFMYAAVRWRAIQAWKAVGLEPITMHECRHTFASILFARRVSPVQIQHWMGHRDLQTTLSTYTHLIPGSELDEITRANQPITLRVIEGGRQLEAGPARQSRDSFSA